MDQIRFRYSDGSHSPWQDVLPGENRVVQSLVDIVEFRTKPPFEPGYYEANTTTHDVRWFTSPPENPAWKRVEVTRVDE